MPFRVQTVRKGTFLLISETTSGSIMAVRPYTDAAAATAERDRLDAAWTPLRAAQRQRKPRRPAAADWRKSRPRP